MKNESKIEELLAESLKRPDQQKELTDLLVQGQAKLLLAVNSLADNQKETNKQLASIADKLTEISDLKRRIEEIEKFIGMK